MFSIPIIMGSACSAERNRAFSSINEKGKIEVTSFRDKNNFFATKTPFLRGIMYLFLGVYLFLMSFNHSKYDAESRRDVEIETKTKPEKMVILWSILGITGSIILFLAMIILPYFVYTLLYDHGLNIWLIRLSCGAVRLVALVLSLACLRAVPNVRQFYRYSSAGNLAVAEAQGKKIDSYHLSTNYLNFCVWSLSISIFVLSFISSRLNFALVFFLDIAIIFVAFSLTYEFLKLFEFKNAVWAKAVIYPISFLVNEKPTKTEREIAFCASNEVKLMMENEKRIIGDIKNAETAFSVVYTEVKDRLQKAGIDDVAEVDWLIAECLDKKRAEIKMLTQISKEDYKKIKLALAKREKRMPISKIFNRVNFYGYDLYVDKNVLSPRFETEQVVEETIKNIKANKKNKIKVLDLMTGSGAIAIVIAKRTNAKVYASDISETALTIAKRNAKNNEVKIKFVKSDIFYNLKREKFDFIVSNPPYIASKEIQSLDDEVKKYDPTIALDGGDDGLFFYREIAENAPQHLVDNGILVLEIGFNQAKSVKKLLQNNFENIRIKKDYSGNDRIVIATKKERRRITLPERPKRK